MAAQEIAEAISGWDPHDARDSWPIRPDRCGCSNCSASAAPLAWICEPSQTLFWLSDEAWAAIEPHLPMNQPGARRVDDRRVISGIIHMLKCGGRWADCPAAYGPATTVCNRWNRWSRRGIWTHILEGLTEEGWIAETGQIDSSYIKAHRSAGSARGGREPMPLASRVAAGQRRSMPLSMSSDGRFASS
jgi:transposase